ncbi:unnamed protein product [Clonostachys rosea]|uniref:Xylanolytic transcriptional activator regulatory domain-containing protein n=1 Tax=Bionectria ochroleuca TaxID=29856 RepID=A0ABY6UIT4_BIOOC|nr:unnamed protein product [Clonostachys rosea]
MARHPRAETACVPNDVVCVSQDPSTKRRHPRGYLESLEQHNASLEQHIAFLESTIRQMQPDTDIDSLTSANGGIEAKSGPNDNSGAIQLDESPRMEERGLGTIEDEYSKVELLCLQSSGEPHYFGASSAYSFSRLFSSTLRAWRSQAPGLSMSGITESTVQARPRPAPVSLPDRALVTMLTSSYFEQVHPQFPFLHRPTYLRWEEDVLSALAKDESPDPTSLFFVYALSAVGALTTSIAAETLPEGLYASAEELFEHVMKLNSVKSIQAILCCAMYSIRSPVGVSVWTLSGLALRQCIELGLHRQIRWSRAEADVLQTQVRRRVFWCSYNLDRAAALTLGRPVGIADSDIDVDLPLDINDEKITSTGLIGEPRVSQLDPPTTVSAAIHTIRLRQLLARIQAVMYPQTGREPPSDPVYATTFRGELDEWLASSPKQLAANRAHNNAFSSPEWFQVMYWHSILTLYRYQLVQNSANVSPAVHLDCANAAQSICAAYRQLYLAQRLNDTWGALHVLFLGGITFLHCLWSSADVRLAYRLDKVSSTCTSCIIVLAVMAERWTAVKPYRDAFDMLSNATQSMLAEAGPMLTDAAMPVLTSHSQDQFLGYLSSMTEIGMCPTVEQLLNGIID